MLELTVFLVAYYIYQIGFWSALGAAGLAGSILEAYIRIRGYYNDHHRTYLCTDYRRI